ncbi:putative bifunctional diguanylate cyclase/phosphodiesterase [Demequina aestuarii]|uniref:putative bifunctional diguanylate cyclase/phosphodiesterase n=1 Tax=Demequina aestuarii TaxID=327095 RepID=UPI00078498A5|nr:bifunctional diguanylate cyclase/phosphodiesterase [Demequina aestuarii]
MRRRAFQVWPTAAAVLGVVVAASLMSGGLATGVVGRLVASAVFFGGWAAVRSAARGERDDAASPWIWIARACGAMGVGTVLATVVDGDHEHIARSIGHVATIVAAMLVYQGMVRWNRFRSGTAAPHDWLNGLSALLAGTAALQAAAVHGLVAVDATSPLPAMEVASGLLVLGTMATISHLAGLRRDPRFWLTCGAFVVIATVQVISSVRGGMADLVLITWTLAAALCIAWACHGPRRGRGQMHPASAGATAAGSIVVLAASVGTLLVEDVAHLAAQLATAETNGRIWPAALAGAAAAGAILRLAGMVRDHSILAVTRHEARTDDLTDLGNRRALLEYLDRAQRRRRPLGLVLVDLDDFKSVNDKHGHPVGDELLRTVGRALSDVLPAGGLAARIGGDEFALAIDGAPGEAGALAERTAHALSQIVVVAGSRITVKASIGVAASVGDTRVLLWRADVALYGAKRSDDTVVTFDRRLGEAADDRRRMRDELRDALATADGAREQFVVWYQPQLDAQTARVNGVEALVRWNRPGQGLLDPGAFLVAVEDAGLMLELTDHVLRTACAQAARWAADEIVVRISVNVAPSVLAHERLLTIVGDSLRESGLPESALVVEITETAAIAEHTAAVLNAQELRHRGVAVSIDDYGTGYSSLTRLHRLPADEIKLDRRFTADLEHDDRARVIVSATIDLAHQLGHRVIAEGVEDHATLGLLACLGCDEVQGWVHARAMPADQLTTWLANRQGTIVATDESARAVAPQKNHHSGKGRTRPPLDSGETTWEARSLAW